MGAFLLVNLQCLRAEKPRQHSQAQGFTARGGGSLLGTGCPSPATQITCSYLPPALSHLILAHTSQPTLEGAFKQVAQ